MENVATLMEKILYEVKKVVVGQDHFLERVLVATLAQGHLLVEGGEDREGRTEGVTQLGQRNAGFLGDLRETDLLDRLLREQRHECVDDPLACRLAVARRLRGRRVRRAPFFAGHGRAPEPSVAMSVGGGEGRVIPPMRANARWRR